ncbi:MAG: HAD family hydrolase [Phycisphaerales bacterium]|nr:HAD family hydrolase [Phycisphaerales bacterium]
MILFDWGGTLVEVSRQAFALRQGILSAGVIQDDEAGNEAANRLREAFQTADARASSGPPWAEFNMDEVVAEWLSTINYDAAPGRLKNICDGLRQAWVGSLDPFPGALETVAQLKTRGYRLGLVSNCSVPPLYCRQELARQGFSRLLDFAVFSSEIGFRKPSPEIYQEAIRQAFPDGRPADLSNVLFVGDSPAYDVSAPAALGMKTALVRCRHGIWPAADYDEARPYLHIDAVSDLPALLD